MTNHSIKFEWLTIIHSWVTTALNWLHPMSTLYSCKWQGGTFSTTCGICNIICLFTTQLLQRSNEIKVSWLITLPTTEYPAFVDSWCSVHTGHCLCGQSSGLLQRGAVWHVYCSHTPATDGTECRRSYGRWYRQIRTHHTGASWHSSLAASYCEDTVQDCCFDLWLCPRYWSCLHQASHLPSLGVVTSVTPFSWPQRPVRFAGKHIYRPAKFLHRGSSHLERTSTRPPLTTQQLPTVPI